MDTADPTDTPAVSLRNCNVLAFTVELARVQEPSRHGSSPRQVQGPPGNTLPSRTRPDVLVNSC
jgi:hypothetical protein